MPATKKKEESDSDGRSDGRTVGGKIAVRATGAGGAAAFGVSYGPASPTHCRKASEYTQYVSLGEMTYNFNIFDFACFRL